MVAEDPVYRRKEEVSPEGEWEGPGAFRAPPACNRDLRTHHPDPDVNPVMMCVSCMTEQADDPC